MPDRIASTDDADARGFVLAGGQSSRMGSDKALVVFAGRPLIAHAIETLSDAGLTVAIAGARPELESTLAAHAPVVRDPQPGLGPLAGICAALEVASSRSVVFLPVDLPLLPASLIVHLLYHARITGSAVTVPTVNGFAQTFPVALDRSLLPALKAELNSGNRGCFSAFEVAAKSAGQSLARVAVELLAQSGQVAHPFGLHPSCLFLNVNAPPDLQRAEALWPRAIA
jgi:molybdopterin-guanine dinucleotide biosynthesis protein A